MKLVPMNMERKISRALQALLLALTTTLLSTVMVQGAPASMSLQGKNKGDTNWIAGNLQLWSELDYIPCRVHMENSQGNGQTITINFEHVNGQVPGVQNLFFFTSSSNVVYTAPPTLSAPPADSA